MQNSHLSEILSHIERREDCYIARFNGYVLESVFQPIFSLFHQRSGGSEALVRGVSPDGRRVSAFEVLGLAEKTGEERVFLDRLLRTLHLANASLRPKEKQWIFLNLDPVAAVFGRHYGSFFLNLLSHFAIHPYQVVVEILESGIADENLLTEAGAYYRAMGCLLAIDDFGAGHSNFDRIWSFKPDIVKVDRSMVQGAAENGRIRRLLPGIVSLLRESGALVVLEGVETEEEARVVFETEADFVQGFYFARPESAFFGVSPLPTRKISEIFPSSSQMEKSLQSIAKIGECLMSLSREHSMMDSEAKIAEAFNCPGAVRFYVLDIDGSQRGETVSLSGTDDFCDLRFAPIQNARGANWSRRGYFKNAVRRIGTIQISSPYLSLTGAHLCRTVSIAIKKASDVLVFCVDVNWLDAP